MNIYESEKHVKTITYTIQLDEFKVILGIEGKLDSVTYDEDHHGYIIVRCKEDIK